MSVYIGIEDLAANALIVMLKKQEKRYVSFAELDKYGSKVVSLLSEKGKTAILIRSRESTNALFRNYSDFFEATDEHGISLREDVEIHELERAFRGYLAFDVLLAFIDETAISELGVS